MTGAPPTEPPAGGASPPAAAPAVRAPRWAALPFAAAVAYMYLVLPGYWDTFVFSLLGFLSFACFMTAIALVMGSGAGRRAGLVVGGIVLALAAGLAAGVVPAPPQDPDLAIGRVASVTGAIFGPLTAYLAWLGRAGRTGGPP